MNKGLKTSYAEKNEKKKTSLNGANSVDSNSSSLRGKGDKSYYPLSVNK